MRSLWPFSPRSAPARESQADPYADLRFYTLQTVYGSVVRAAAEGLLIHEQPSFASGAHEAVVIRLDAVPNYAFIAAACDTPVELGMQNDKLRAPILSYRVRRHGDPQTIVLRHPLAEIYASALPEPNGGSSSMVIDRLSIGGWETFRLLRSDARPLLPTSLLAALSSIRPVLASGFSIAAILEWLAEASAAQLANVGQALLRLAPPDAIAAVGVAIIEQPGLADRIAAAWPDNPFSSAVLPALAAWTRDRALRTAIPVGTDLDMLAGSVGYGQPVTDLPLHLVAAARRHVQPTRGIAIMATARNEGPFFLDWIAHHRALGVAHFFIYSSDDNDDRSDTLLAGLAEHGIITHLHNQVSPSGNRQRKAYNHAFLCLPELLDFRWTATIDLDEYLLVDPNEFESLSDFLELQESRGADAVSLNWRMYGPERQLTFSDRPFAERLLRRRRDHNSQVKTIVRTNQVWGTLHHAPLWPDRVKAVALDALGNPHYSPGLVGGIGVHREAPDLGPAWINHYFFRSLPETILNFARSSADDGGTHELRFTAHFIPGLLGAMNAELVEDRTILAWSDAVGRERDALCRLPGIASAHDATVMSFCEAANRLVRDTPAHANEIPDDLRSTYLALIEESIARGVAAPVNVTATTNAPTPVSSSPDLTGELVMRFESLGDNCEFGLLQRRLGRERLGLLRYAGCRHADLLLAGIKDSFEALSSVDDIATTTFGDEWIAHSKRYAFTFHTGVYTSAMDEEQIRAAESTKLSFMAQLLAEDFQTGHKVFVRRVDEGDVEEGMWPIYRAIRAHGLGRLLWVTRAEPGRPHGHVERLAEGLYRGFHGNLAPYSDAHASDAELWLTLLGAAETVMRGAS